MSRAGSRPTDSNRTWRYALIGGVSSIPFTVAGYWQTGSEMSLSPVLFGGILAGYLASRGTGDSRGVGVRVGLVGGLPILWVLVEFLGLTPGLSGPSWFVAGWTAIAVWVAVGVGVLAFAISAFVGVVGVRIGSWLAARFSGPQRPPVSGS